MFSSSFTGLVCGLACASACAWGQYVISTIAGEGPPASPGYSGDNGPATGAQMYFPTGIAYSKGKLYIADQTNHCVRMIAEMAKRITTFAGVCGTPGFLGDGAAATLANLNNPSGVAVDPNGDVLIADTSNNVVRIVVPSGIISTFAGNQSMGAGYTGDGGVATSGQLDAPTAIACDSAGNVYVTDLAHGLRAEDQRRAAMYDADHRHAGLRKFLKYADRYRLYRWLFESSERHRDRSVLRDLRPYDFSHRVQK